MVSKFEREANKSKRRAQKEAKKAAKAAAKAAAMVVNRPDRPLVDEPKADEEQEPP